MNSNQELRPLLDKARALTALQHHFVSVAPPLLAGSSLVLGLHLGTLSIAVANSTIAAKLRQHAPDMVVQLQNKGLQVSGIRVKVQVAFERSRPKPSPRKLSQAALSALDQLSSNLNDSPLKLALKKMSRNQN